MYATQYQLYLGQNNPVTGKDYTRDEIVEWCNTYIAPVYPGYTITEGTGYWKGQPEQVTIVTLIGEEKDSQTVRLLAGHYKTMHQQEAVLVTKLALDAEFV